MLSFLTLLIVSGALDKAKEAAKKSVTIEGLPTTQQGEAESKPMPSLGAPQPVAEINLNDADSNPWVVDYAAPIALNVVDVFDACSTGEMTTPVIMTVDQPVEKMRVRVTQPEIKLKGGMSRGLFVVQSPDGSYYCSEISNDEELVVSGPAGEWLIFVGHNGQPNIGIERPFTLSVEDPNKDLTPDLDGSEAEHRSIRTGESFTVTSYHLADGDQSDLLPARRDGRICHGRTAEAPAMYLDLETAQRLRVSGDAGDSVALVGPINGRWRDIKATCMSGDQEVPAGTWAVYPVSTYGSKGIYTLSVSSGEAEWEQWAPAWEPAADTPLSDREIWRVFPHAGIERKAMDITRSYELMRAAPPTSFVFVADGSKLSPMWVGEGSTPEAPAAGEAMLLIHADMALGADGSFYSVDEGALTIQPPAAWVQPTLRNMPGDFGSLMAHGLRTPSVDAFYKADGADSNCRSVSSTRYANATEGQILTQAQAKAASDRLSADNAKCAVHAKAAAAAKDKAVVEMQAEWSSLLEAQYATTLPGIQARLGL